MVFILAILSVIKNINRSEIQAINWVQPANSEGEYLSESFPPRILTAYMSAPAKIINNDTYF